MPELTVRQYAAKEGITLGTAYRRIWEGTVSARQLMGRWLVTPVPKPGVPKIEGPTVHSLCEALQQ